MKLLLHGPYASGAWVDDPGGRYFADYDLLVLVSSEGTGGCRVWLECERSMLFASVNRTPQNACAAHDPELRAIRQRIYQGNRYFQNIMEECVVLHDADPTVWPDCNAVAALDVVAQADRHRAEGFALVAEFLGSAKLSAADGWFRKAARSIAIKPPNDSTISPCWCSRAHPHTITSSTCGSLPSLQVSSFASCGRLRQEIRRCFELLRAAYNSPDITGTIGSLPAKHSG